MPCWVVTPCATWTSLGHAVAGPNLVHGAVDARGHDQPAPPHLLDPRHRAVVEPAGRIVVAPADTVAYMQFDFLQCKDRHGITIEVFGQSTGPEQLLGPVRHAKPHLVAVDTGHDTTIAASQGLARQVGANFHHMAGPVGAHQPRAFPGGVDTVEDGERRACGSDLAIRLQLGLHRMVGLAAHGAAGGQ